MRLKLEKIFLGFILLMSIGHWSLVIGQELPVNSDSLSVSPKLTKDTVILFKDTSISPNAIKSKVKYTAKDSIRFDIINQKVYLYGKAEIHYETIILQAGHIAINWDDRTVYAEGIKDSLGNMRELPVYKEGGQSFKSNTMKYNFDTKRGKITYLTTKEGEGFVHGETVKKDSTNVFYIRHGRYTTCEEDSPHFYIATQKLKVIQNNKIVTGPACLFVEGIPTPLAIPFGFFPSKNGQASGILFPTYGNSTERGYFLTNGGYYFGISDYIDLAVRGDVYSRGSWAAKTAANYLKKYKYNGNLNLNFSKMKNGEEGFSGYQPPSQDFNIQWSHRQDGKARPGSQFSANVNVISSAYFKNNINTSASNYLSNTFQSSISYSKTMDQFNLSVNLAHSQNTISKTVDLSLPDISLSRNRMFPFKRKVQIGEEKWYEKINIGWSAASRNQIHVDENSVFNIDSLSKFRKGMQQNIPISTSFKVMKYFTLSPSVNIIERWYLQSIRKEWVKSSDTTYALITRDVNGFKRAGDFGLSTSLSTIIYGMFEFKNFPVKAIRHVITPVIGTSWRPDFSERWGYYATLYYLNGTKQTYSYFEKEIYGSPLSGKSGMLSISVDNNIEMKVRNLKDTVTGEKKIKLVESFSFRTDYNVAVDSMNWTPVSMSGRTMLFNKISLSFNGTLDPYAVNSLGQRIKKYAWDEYGLLGRFTDGNLAMSFNLNQDVYKPKVSKKGTEQEMKMINANPDDYVDFNIPWSLNVNYTLNYTKGFNLTPASSKEITQSLNFSGDLRITPQWKLAFNSGYDFINKDLTYTSIDFYRDLHCWEMKFHWIPFGPSQSWNFQINVKSAVLQDLKLTKKKDPWDK